MTRHMACRKDKINTHFFPQLKFQESKLKIFTCRLLEDSTNYLKRILNSSFARFYCMWGHFVKHPIKVYKSRRHIVD
jgi:hypothetical protein